MQKLAVADREKGETMRLDPIVPSACFGFVNSAQNCFCLSLLGPTEPRRAKVLGQLYAFSGKAGLAAPVPDSQKGSWGCSHD